MNTNQLIIKFNEMKKTNQGGRCNIKQTIVQWMAFLNDLKCSMDEKSVFSLHTFVTKHRVGTLWSGFLKEKNIISRSDDGYVWNPRIPVSIKLITEYRKFQNERYLEYAAKNHSNKVKNEKITPKNNIKAQQPPKYKNVQNTNRQEIGLIRKFLKWIY